MVSEVGVGVCATFQDQDQTTILGLKLSIFKIKVIFHDRDDFWPSR